MVIHWAVFDFIYSGARTRMSTNTDKHCVTPAPPPFAVGTTARILHIEQCSNPVYITLWNRVAGLVRRTTPFGTGVIMPGIECISWVYNMNPHLFLPFVNAPSHFQLFGKIARAEY